MAAGRHLAAGVTEDLPGSAHVRPPLQPSRYRTRAGDTAARGGSRNSAHATDSRVPDTFATAALRDG